MAKPRPASPTATPTASPFVLRPCLSLQPNPANPRTVRDAGFRALVESIKTLGVEDGAPCAFQPVIVNTNPEAPYIVGGQRRWEAAQDAGFESIWVREVNLTAEQVRELTVRLNVPAGDWDWEVLAQSGTGREELTQWGFDEDAFPEFEGFGADPEPPSLTPLAPDQGAKVDQAEELLERWGVRPGQLWVIPSSSTPGAFHEIHCSGEISDLRGREIGCMVIDPPWDAMDLAGALPPARSRLVFADGRRISDAIRVGGQDPAWLFSWDCGACWYAPNRPLQRQKLCLWYGDIASYNADGSHYGVAESERQVTNSRGTYTYTPDPRGKHLADLFAAQLAKLHQEEHSHHHGKPLDWIRMLIANTSTGLIVDPFLGGGTTIIAAEQLGRPCVGVEIEPKWVAVTLQRAKDFGLEPRLASGVEEPATG